ncbi:MAG: glycoside hydrolase family 2 protein, partial [Thermoprotei archaeon]
LVWQDFMFACGSYPRDHWFLLEAEEEARIIVKRLRNHPSIVLWCGDNENDSLMHPEGDPLNRFVLKEVCEIYDPDKPYWPSSPHGGENPNDPSVGDTHIWHHGEPYNSEVYKREILEARFISEIGHLSCPSIETMAKFLPSNLMWPPNDLWKYHFGTVDDAYAWWGDPKRREKMENSIKSFWGKIPKTLEEYVYVSQLLQAIAYKYWVEESRVNELNSGILLWNVTDSWPQFSDSVIDYYRRPKLA